MQYEALGYTEGDQLQKKLDTNGIAARWEGMIAGWGDPSICLFRNCVHKIHKVAENQCPIVLCREGLVGPRGLSGWKPTVR